MQLRVDRCPLAVIKVCCDSAGLLPLRFKLQIFRLPGKGDYSTRSLRTISFLITWVEVYVASVTYFPPYGEKGQQLGKEGQERELRWERKRELCDRRGGGLECEDVASERQNEYRLRRFRSCVESSLTVLRVLLHNVKPNNVYVT
jgi:hypothetical protein